ncbi:Predicted Zn-dependent protease or its inactivated homolog [Catalinimonas alkaloidigena]|uniref:Predicted Zn-dependent protease or its inactivated homolog n=1 Tax=Catalinimonas alkaloidigena TaxID=1075417 RepID=A0A1G9KY82_9BACT|nr:TldD/PmbA family protein [Catalinimonas alkaloidigena]SDL54556.1 Predicted Zn-dependent protease or its inactivated homolog [Catalinimonas alkaloidigena]
MAILSEAEAKQILQKVIGFSKADECEANLNGSTQGNIRYARNTVSTSGSETNTSLVVQSAFGKKAGTATVNEFDDASLEKAVRRSEELAQLAPENPEYMPVLGPQQYQKSPTFVQATADITPDYRAQVAASSIEPARKKDVTAAGFLQDSAGFSSMMNSKGLFAYNQETGMDFTVTMRTNDGTGSGWVSRDYNDVRKFNAAEASQIAIEKALQSRNAKAIEPGKYTVILEPAASVDLLQNMVFNMSARTADEGRSFLSKKGEPGKNRKGEKLLDERVHIYIDPQNPDLPTATWSGDGLPVKKMDLISNGVVKNLFYDRYWAQQQGVEPVAFGRSFIMEGGSGTIEDLIRDTQKGILVTRMWYIRTVDPQTLLYTGLTRDGLFYVENGKIQYPLKNFRFNESPVIMLNNLEALGKQYRVDGNLVPVMKIRDFTFTSLSDAV